MTRPETDMDRWSKKIDETIEKEKEIKAQLPDHPRFSAIRIKLDNDIKGLRETKKEALKYWRELKRNPRITP